MRDPAVLAVFTLHLSAAELAAVLAGASIVRPFWPPQSCRGSVVGLHAEGAVHGEALLAGVQAAEEGPGSRRAMSSPMPAAPLGTLGQAEIIGPPA